MQRKDWSKPWYNPKRDGSLEEFLEKFDFSCTPLFKGYEHYKLLWDKGYLEKDISIIRLMWNMGRDDEHFIVIGEYQIQGLRLPAHSGREGIYDPRILLEEKDCPSWEAQSLNPNPKQGRK
jgi:hypothetical protein